MVIKVICLLTENKPLSLSDNGNINFPNQLCLGSISNGFGATGSR